MQVIEYAKQDVDLLFRKQIEQQLMEIANEHPAEEQAFDCMEFGFCVMNPSYDLWRISWFKPRKSRATKPRTAVTVTATDGLTKSVRRRWQFAMSHLGFLYPISYEYQTRIAVSELWVSELIYRVWGRSNPSIADVSDAIPDDTICREAERLFLKKVRHKGRR